ISATALSREVGACQARLSRWLRQASAAHWSGFSEPTGYDCREKPETETNAVTCFENLYSHDDATSFMRIYSAAERSA
ncbi:MAG: hypothetical protein R6U13_07925, partial [Desulfatiglandaceae bacterium]